MNVSPVRINMQKIKTFIKKTTTDKKRVPPGAAK